MKNLNNLIYLTKRAYTQSADDFINWGSLFPLNNEGVVDPLNNLDTIYVEGGMPTDNITLQPERVLAPVAKPSAPVAKPSAPVAKKPSLRIPSEYDLNVNDILPPNSDLFSNLEAYDLKQAYDTARNGSLTDISTISERPELFSPPPMVNTDTVPVLYTDALGNSVFKLEPIYPGVTLDRGYMEEVLNKPDPKKPITLRDLREPLVPSKPATPEEKQAWYDKLVNWIKENPWTAGAGALGLGGLGYYLLSDDDEEEEEEE